MTTGVPRPLQRYFWDYDPEELSLEQSRETILGRLLRDGGWDATRWLRGELGDEEIRAWLERRQGRGLSPRRLRFWGLVLGLPVEQVDEWVANARDAPWGRRAGLRLASLLKEEGVRLEVESVAEGTLHGSVDGVRVSFLEYRYPTIAPPEPVAPFGCRVAGLEDLACIKLAAVAGRGSKKDFIDIQAIGESGLALSRMLELYRQRYDVADVGHVVFSLTYFDDADKEEGPVMLTPVTWDEVKRTIGGWVRELARGER